MPLKLGTSETFKRLFKHQLQLSGGRQPLTPVTPSEELPIFIVFCYHLPIPYMLFLKTLLTFEADAH